MTSGSLKTALSRSLEENTVTVSLNKDGDVTHFTRSKVSQAVLSQRSQFFKLGEIGSVGSLSPH